MIDPTGGDLDPAPGNTRRAQATALTRECNEEILTARDKAGPDETVHHNATLEVATNRPLGVGWHGVAVPLMLSQGQSGRQVGVDDPV